MENLQMEGFRIWLDKAIRVEQGRDWSIHTIDYSAFKRKLNKFSKRRALLRRHLATSNGGTILASELDEILGPPPTFSVDVVIDTEQSRSTLSDTLGPLVKGELGRDHVRPSSSDSQIQYVAFADPEARVLSSYFDFSPQLQQGGPFTIEKKSTSPTSLFWGPPRVKRLSALRQVSKFERNDMMIFLALELDKVAMFYVSQWQAISQRLLDYETSTHGWEQDLHGGHEMRRTTDPFLQVIGKELLELEAFVVVNLVTVRQILIRYDAFVRSLDGTPMSDYYMKFMMNPGLRFWEADSRDGALSRSFRKLLQHAELLALCEKFEDITSARKYHELNERFCYQRMEFAMTLESSEREQIAASTGHVVPAHDTVLLTLRHYFLVGMIEDRLGYEPKYLTSRGKSLLKEMQAMAAWREKFSGQWGDKVVVEEAEDGVSLSFQERFNLVMALLAAFLYCMNYYIVEPSSTMYVNALGGQDALSGALIGMMPMASFLAAIAYSIWTNHSFRHPFMVSCFLMLVGNLVYSYAYETNSLCMAFVGRFMTGLGGPKCIVRRYMADTTSISIRTSVNAFFGMAVAAGSAFGPGCAILLSRLNFIASVPGNVKLNVNGMTGPGYLMATLWTILTIALCIRFTEPDRSGLKEQKRLEGIKSKPEVNGDNSVRCQAISGQAAQKQTISPLLTPGLDHRVQTSGAILDSRTFYSGMSFDADGWKDEDDFEYVETVSSSFCSRIQSAFALVTLPMRICLGLLFAKVFVIETLVSSTSTLSKNRYQWQVREVGILGCVNGLVVIPLSIFVGRLSMSYPDRVIMMWLLGIGFLGVLRLVDVTDLQKKDEAYTDSFFSVGPIKYILGYFTIYMSIQSFEGVVGSTLSKVVPTALATGTLNSGLLATLVDTFGRTCGDLFICLVAFVNLEQLINLLFIPGAIILATCLVAVRKNYDLLAV